jgi:hypothetical protein
MSQVLISIRGTVHICSVSGSVIAVELIGWDGPVLGKDTASGSTVPICDAGRVADTPLPA